MKPTKKDKARLEDWVSGWQKTFNLHDWSLTVSYKEDDKEVDAEAGAALGVERQFNYLRAQINVYPAFWEEEEKYQWEHVCHELIHVVLSEYDKLIYGAQDGRAVPNWDMHRVREQTTVRLTNLLTSIYPYKPEK